MLINYKFNTIILLNVVLGITLRKGESKRRVSLGFPCINDAQCMRNDENARCINSICDCQSNKTSDQCSAKSRGCLHNTFQVNIFTYLVLIYSFIIIILKRGQKSM